MLLLHPLYRKSRMPVGQSGDWVIDHFQMPELTVEQQQADRRPAWIKSGPGQYTRLRCGYEVFMTDLYDEWCTQQVAMEQALQRGGSVLTTGLGLGMIVETILSTPGCPVEGITVIEQSPDVMRLVVPHLQGQFGERLQVIYANVFTWEPPAGQHYSVIWHDIWPNPVDPAIEPEIQCLHDRFQAYGDWQGDWAREYQTLAAASH